MRESLAVTASAAIRVPPVPVKSPASGVVLAFDCGTRRIGVAIGNTVTCTARPLETIESSAARRWSRIAELIAAWSPDRLVVGAPSHPDGAPHEMTAHAERFARQLEGRFKLTVTRVDERYSTTAVARDEPDIDAAAAAVILQQYLSERAR